MLFQSSDFRARISRKRYAVPVQRQGRSLGVFYTSEPKSFRSYSGGVFKFFFSLVKFETLTAITARTWRPERQHANPAIYHDYYLIRRTENTPYKNINVSVSSVLQNAIVVF